MACAKYPNDIAAYIGIGQCIDYTENEDIAYKFTCDMAAKYNDKKAIKTLKEIEKPYNGKYQTNHQESLMRQRAILHKFGGATLANHKPYWQELLFHDAPILLKEYSLVGLLKYIKGINYCINSPLATENPDFINFAKELKVPVYLLLGHHDYNCSFELAERWLSKLVAPHKELIWFENSAHSPQWKESEKFNREFLKIVDNLEIT